MSLQKKWLRFRGSMLACGATSVACFNIHSVAHLRYKYDSELDVRMLNLLHSLALQPRRQMPSAQNLINQEKLYLDFNNESRMLVT